MLFLPNDFSGRSPFIESNESIRIRALASSYVRSFGSFSRDNLLQMKHETHEENFCVLYSQCDFNINAKCYTHTRARSSSLSVSIARSLSPGYSESHSAKQNVYYWMLVMLMMLLLLPLLLSRFHTHCTCRATHISSYYPQMEKHTHKSVQKEEK